MLSTYLALYQYGLLAHVWEPLFGGGSARVLNSGLLDPLSRRLGIPLHDAALGTVGYALEAVLTWIMHRSGSAQSRWTAAIYLSLVSLLGVAGLILVVLQAIWIHAWCTLCLLSALISEAIVLLSFHKLKAATAAVMRQLRLGRRMGHVEPG
jgi:uncharacterized membrane protein